LITTLPTEVPDDEYPLWLITGTIFAHYLTGTMTRRCSTLNHENPRVFFEISDCHFKKILFVLEKTGLKNS
jgi:anaerobic selenocysteine-containing dehydrogenase